MFNKFYINVINIIIYLIKYVNMLAEEILIIAFQMPHLEYKYTTEDIFE